MRIIICGTGKCAEQLMSMIGKRKDISIICFSETKKSKSCWCGYPVIENSQITVIDDYDYIVIAAMAFEEIKENLRLFISEENLEKIFFYTDFLEMLITTDEYAPFLSVETEDGVGFIYDKRDQVIGPYMRMRRRVFAYDEIDGFFALTEKYYKSRKGFFLDIGANIGTTSIYVKKKNPELSVLAIEPGLTNYRILRANCELNGMSEIRCLRCGLSNKSIIDQYHYIAENPGASAIVQENGRKLTCAVTRVNQIIDTDVNENVTLKTLMQVLAEQKVETDEIGYLWIDTQGHEARIIEGAMPLLKNRKIPLFQEFSPNVYKENGDWEKYLINISDIYEAFIDYDRFRENSVLRSICDLENLTVEMKREHREFTNLFFV